MRTIAQALEEEGDFVHLHGNAEYRKYFVLLTRAIETLASWYQGVEGGDDEEKIVVSFLRRMLNTAKLLSLKHGCGDEPQLRLDLRESGFPHLLGIMALEADLRRKEEELRSIDTAAVLKQRMITHMIEKKEDPVELVATMSLRTYFELLDEDRILLPFTPGQLVLKSEDERHRRYLYSWCCYDVTTNVPHVYLMTFDQDTDQEPLHEGGSSYARFMDVVRGEGSRVPALNVVAAGIDQCIESIHPKILKRIKLGSLLTVAYSKEDHPLLEYLRQYGGEDDFIFHIKDEMVYSARQVQRKGGFLSTGEVREIFAVPQEDIECARAGVSRINRMMLLPHHLLQHLNPEDPAVTQYTSKATYTKNGEVYAT